MVQRMTGTTSIKERITALFSSIGSLIASSCGGACGVACIAGGCCGSTALFGLIGLSGSTLRFFEKLTPLFLGITILSLSYAFYKAYKPTSNRNCNTANTDDMNTCCAKEKKMSFFQSKSFLWAITILCAIMWLYPYAGKIVQNAAGDFGLGSQGSCSTPCDIKSPGTLKTSRPCCP